MSETIVDFDQDRNYYAVIREFAGGAIEAVTKCVRPMQMEQAKSRYQLSGGRDSLRLASESPSELSAPDRSANHSRAVRRAKQSIRWLAKNMQADRLFTLTYRANVEDREQVKTDFTKFLRLVRKHIGTWEYVAVLERQDRGSYHIHCAVKGWQKISILRACWYRALGGTGTETGESTPGQVDVTSPTKRWGKPGRSWRSDKIAGYLTKYLDKTFDETTAEKRRYWSARELSKPTPIRVWLGAAGPVECITETVSFLQTFYGVCPDFDMWLSPDKTCFWFGGKIECVQ